MLKTLLVYTHLIAACLAIGVLLIQDHALAKWRGRAMDADTIFNFQRNCGLVTFALVVLWVSGLAIVTIGYLEVPNYLMNQKLWAKFTVVSILTINGLFLHYYSFPVLASPRGFAGASGRGQLLVVITAVVSLVSWLYACYLGIARPWNNTVPFAYVMVIYSLVLAITLVIALEVWRGLRSEYRSLAQ
uniref:DUF2214 domain-containing protein n=1 Tax=Cellvibrio fontiphilus TaxID=1815559 RepID=UPI002B4BCBB8|nr:DUF2214 domain-containing protein [Cellvibrio fontiphilus]